MRFKSQQRSNQLPGINLTPMLNVMMGILAFFVMITMMLSEEQGLEVPLPSNEPRATQQDDLPPLIVELDATGQFAIEQVPVNSAQVLTQVQTYLAENPGAFVVLQADRQLPYERVVQALAELKQIGGDRVSLAVDP
ncbi:ExbD/TolR family protein [Leptolyngbya sp. AN02str]|uniref:ExbD/TolR family protein n=1 Tax=Leptolyngbya sp. AN02str TaxID=3423363 RepID=UPI003D30FB8F